MKPKRLKWLSGVSEEGDGSFSWLCRRLSLSVEFPLSVFCLPPYEFAPSGSLLRRGLFVLWGGFCVEAGEKEKESARGTSPARFLFFSIIDILMGIPSGSLCGGERPSSESLLLCDNGQLHTHTIVEIFWKNSSYVSGLSVWIFVALCVRMYVAGIRQERAYSGIAVSPAWRLDRKTKRRLILQDMIINNNELY